MILIYHNGFIPCLHHSLLADLDFIDLI